MLVSDSLASLSTTRRTSTSERVLPVETESFSSKRHPEEKTADSVQEDSIMEERPAAESMMSESSRSSSQFLTPDDVCLSSINATLSPFYFGSQKIQILHEALALKILYTHLKVRFGISTMFADQGGYRRLSFVVDAPPSLCQVLEACDFHAQSLFMRSGSMSDRKPVVNRKNGFMSFPTIRLHIPTVKTGDVAKYGTEMLQNEASSGTEQKLVLSQFDPSELETLFTHGTSVDAYFSMDTYDYQQKADIRLVSEKLVIHTQ